MRTNAIPRTEPRWPILASNRDKRLTADLASVRSALLRGCWMLQAIPGGVTKPTEAPSVPTRPRRAAPRTWRFGHSRLRLHLDLLHRLGATLPVDCDSTRQHSCIRIISQREHQKDDRDRGTQPQPPELLLQPVGSFYASDGKTLVTLRAS